MKLNVQQKMIITAIDSAEKSILSVSHQIHDHPEMGYEEVFAADLLTKTLEGFGFAVERGVAGMPTAFRARKGSRPGPRVAILAEYDALPEIGHACGHNVIASSALAAGIGLGAVIEEVGGEVWVMGTPAEETDGGKIGMIEHGAFKDVDAAMMMHPYGTNYAVTESLAMDAIQIEFRGKTAHAAATPWEGKNALDALLLTFSNINALRQQVRPDARIHGIITHGGAAPNIIPDYTAARFYVRAAQRSYLNALVEQFKDCARAAALATGTTVTFSNYERSFDDINTNLPMAMRLRDYLSDVLEAGPFKHSPDGFGSTDMGNVSHVVPAIHTMMDITSGVRAMPHTVEFCEAAISPKADMVILRAGKGMALTGYDLLTDDAFLQQVRSDFERSKSG